jgi:hypothetical protein
MGGYDNVLNFFKSKFFILPVVSLLLFATICYIMLGIFWQPLHHFWAALPAFIIYQNVFYYLWFVLLAISEAVVAGYSFKLIKSKQKRLYFLTLSTVTVFAIFFSLLFLHFHSLCYI